MDATYLDHSKFSNVIIICYRSSSLVRSVPLFKTFGRPYLRSMFLRTKKTVFRLHHLKLPQDTSRWRENPLLFLRFRSRYSPSREFYNPGASRRHQSDIYGLMTCVRCVNIASIHFESKPKCTSIRLKAFTSAILLSPPC